MPIRGARHLFTPAGIADSPKEGGVFILWDRHEAIYIGRTAGSSQTLHASLADHCSGAYGNCTQFATHYSFEVTPRPAPREQELMEEFGSQHGRMPRCQGVVKRRA